ncbi:hypothetical protein BpHYR1_043900 [Brachionus plicatilis]|uniref:Uncharacterized protein n=1 Tax=Brachionus plicatilis TaxID=10195 RepID=A0A3M7SSI4_BRAPC|nr:hypothetical protein BpHYR1_043900 [Brachionus plicatilis]
MGIVEHVATVEERCARSGRRQLQLVVKVVAIQMGIVVLVNAQAAFARAQLGRMVFAIDAKFAAPFGHQIEQIVPQRIIEYHRAFLFGHRVYELVHKHAKVKSNLIQMVVGLVALALHIAVNGVDEVDEHFAHLFVVEVLQIGGIFVCVHDALGQRFVLGHQLKYSDQCQSGQVLFFQPPYLVLSFEVGRFLDQRIELFDEVALRLNVDAAQTADYYLAEIAHVTLEIGHYYFNEGCVRTKIGVEFGSGLDYCKVVVDCSGRAG